MWVKEYNTTTYNALSYWGYAVSGDEEFFYTCEAADSVHYGAISKWNFKGEV